MCHFAISVIFACCKVEQCAEIATCAGNTLRFLPFLRFEDFQVLQGAAIHHFTRFLITKMAGNLRRGSGIYGRTHGGDPVPGSNLEILKQLPKAFSADT